MFLIQEWRSFGQRKRMSNVPASSSVLFRQTSSPTQPNWTDRHAGMINLQRQLKAEPGLSAYAALILITFMQGIIAQEIRCGIWYKRFTNSIHGKYIQSFQTRPDSLSQIIPAQDSTSVAFLSCSGSWVPRGIFTDLSCVPVETYSRREDKVCRIKDRENNNHPRSNKFRLRAVCDNECA